MTTPTNEVVAFWRQAGPGRWFTKDPAFDADFRERFLSAHEAAAAGQLAHWEVRPEDALGLVLLLDQFPRNCFRGTPRMYATDEAARGVTERAVVAGHDMAVEVGLRLFFYLPLAHSELLADQDRSVELHQRLEPQVMRHALEHRDIVRRFGRFPHRNGILGRATTPEEQAFLDAGGFAG